MQQPPQWGQGYGPPTHLHPQHPHHGGGYGYPPQRPPPPKSHTAAIVAAVVGCFIVLVFIAGAVGARKTSSTTTTTAAGERPARAAAPAAPAALPRPVERPIEVDAKTLFDEYEQNEVSADDRYKGKKLLVRGTVQSIDKDFLDDIIVRLATSNQFMGAMAKMDDGEKARASRLRKGQKVAVLCTGRGIVIGTPSLADCTFAD